MDYRSDAALALAGATISVSAGAFSDAFDVDHIVRLGLEAMPAFLGAFTGMLFRLRHKRLTIIEIPWALFSATLIAFFMGRAAGGLSQEFAALVMFVVALGGQSAVEIAIDSGIGSAIAKAMHKIAGGK